jgi:ubiquinone/menaquinone biosynthesis C-methylase UbiE
VPALLDRARERAEVERLPMRFQEADAENLPFDDGTFDVAVSTFGVMFTPDQEQAAAEVMRVVRSGGKIGLANWTPDGFIGQLFRTIGRFVPPPQGVKSPAAWGQRERLQELFGAKVASIEATTKPFVFRYRSPEHWLDIFRTYYGPVLKAFAALPEDGQAQLREALMSLVAERNRSGDGTMVVPSDYLEVVIVKA